MKNIVIKKKKSGETEGKENAAPGSFAHALKRPFVWIGRQFKNHPVRSIAITVPVLALITAGILFICGVFSFSSHEGNWVWNYLPNRDYIIAPTESPEPQTLYELLHSDSPSIDSLLKTPSIAQEIVAAEEWTDIVDSRYALYNLREIDRQLQERLAESIESISAAEFISPENGLLAGTSFVSPISYTSGDTQITNLAAFGNIQSLSAYESIQNQHVLLETVQASTGRLLAPGLITDEDLTQLDAAINLKGVWQNPGEALIHLTPEGDWLPDNGYRLTRIVNGQETVIAERAAAAQNGLAGGIGGVEIGENGEHFNFVQELYRQAQLTPEKLSALGMSSAAEFRKTAYRVDSLEQKQMISGLNDFVKMGELQITIADPENKSQKMPETDRLLLNPILVMETQSSSVSLRGNMNYALDTKFSFVPSMQTTGIDRFRKFGDIQYDTAEEIMIARQEIASLSFVDSEFAEEADFLIHDDLTGLGLTDGTEITYVANADGLESRITLVYGKETLLSQPQGFMGYGYDGLVSLRWDDLSLSDTADPIEKGIISGYHIERKLDGESNFTQITTEPIVIGYMLDELGWLQSPIFYQDDVDNGRTAEYRVRSMDIFGRSSEFSEVKSIKVQKVTPPDAPSVGKPALSTEPERNIPEAVQASIEYNAGMKGIVLPIYNSSPDTERFTIYRAVAVGAGSFGPPVELADIIYENPIAESPGSDATPAAAMATPSAASMQTKYSIDTLPTYSYNKSSLSDSRLNDIKQFLLAIPAPEEPSLVYFDADVEEGCTYKYWISAWDEEERWNNESAWSQSVTAAVPTDKEPEAPSALDISMLARALPDHSNDPPGLVYDAKATIADIGLAGMSYTVPNPSGNAASSTGTINTNVLSTADANDITIGSFGMSGTQPELINALYNNLPEQKYIHTFAAVPGNSVRADGTAMLKWSAYSGDGLKGYNVYQAMFDPPPLDDMQKMSRSELLQLGYWQRVTQTPITANQLTVGGLGGAAGKTTLYLVTLVPEQTQGEIVDEILAEWKNETAPTAPIPPEAPIFPRLDSIVVDVPGSVKVDMQGNVWITITDEYGTREGKMTSGISWTEQSAEYYAGVSTPYYSVRDEGIALYISQLLYSVSSRLYYNEMIQTTTAVSGLNLVTTFEETGPDSLWYKVIKAYSQQFSDATIHCMGLKGPYPELLKAYEEALAIYEEELYVYLTSGYVSIGWDIPADPQVKMYRVYRAEVLSFKKPVNEDLLDWTLVGDNLTAPMFTEPVNQGHALFYYYKVTSVSPWGVETAVGTMQRFRVPSTMPPATPNILVPLQRKDGVQINFSAVQYVDRYIVYRTEIPKITDNYLAGMNLEVKNALFGNTAGDDVFLNATLQRSISLPQSTNLDRTLNAISRFSTLDYAGESTQSAIGELSTDTKMNMFSTVMNDFGPLAFADYRDLSVEMMKRVGWVEVGTLEADNDTVEEVLDPESGLPGMLKPLSIIDRSAEYGKMYLYTVQAWNDDNLGSTRPEPVEATPRRNGPFDPIKGLKGDIKDNKVNLSWDTPTMLNLDKQRCLDETVGYIVYRSDTQDGEYYQASPLVFEPKWTDEFVDIFAFNWYRVRVLDTGGYLSDFSEAVLVRSIFAPLVIMAFIPLEEEAENPPVVNILGAPFTVKQGEKLAVLFEVTGDEPISYAIEGSARAGAAITGMTVDGNEKTITIPDTLPIGAYSATLTATNDAGEGKATFNFTVEETPPEVEAPKIGFPNNRLTVQQGTAFQTNYTLTGTEPITVTLTATNGRGATVAGFTVNTSTKTVSAPASLTADNYTVTATAKNSVGESSASFTLEVTTAATAPIITFAERSYTIKQGASFQTNYNLSGKEPITVTLTATNGRGATVAGFTLNTSARTVSAPASLTADNYTVTATAKNSIGESSATFYLTVETAAEPPVITFRETKFTASESTGFQTSYTLTGTEPITVTVEARNSSGASVAGFTADTYSRTVSAPIRLPNDTYTVTATAENTAGRSSAAFTLTIEPPARIAPKITTTRYENQMDMGLDYTLQFTATGSEPLYWSLEPTRAVSRVATVPTEASINSAGLLTIKGSIEAGSYSFIVRVSNDVGSDTFDFSITVYADRSPIGPIRPIDPSRPRGTSYGGGSSGLSIIPLAAMQQQPSVQQTPSQQPGYQQVTNQHYDSVRIYSFENGSGGAGGYWLDDVNVSAPAIYVAGSFPGYSGTARLRTGGNEGIPVSISGAAFSFESGGQPVMSAGVVYVPQTVELPKIGVTISSMEISIADKKAVVSGYVRSTVEGQNLMGSMYALEFTDARLSDSHITFKRNMFHIKYEQFAIIPKMQLTNAAGSEIRINLDAERTRSDNFITLLDCNVYMKSHLETLNNEGIVFDSAGNLNFNLQGKMSANLATKTGTRQSLQLLVPGGAMLRVESAYLPLRNGVVADESGFLSGILILPFEQDNINAEVSTAAYTDYHPETNEMDSLSLLGYSNQAALSFLNDYIYKFGRTVQQNSLLIVPDDPALQDLLAYVNIDAHGWTGKGFTMEQADMTPARVTNRNIGVEKQRSQATVVSPTYVSVDLDRDSYVNPSANWNKQEPNEYEAKEDMLPKEAQEDFWVGLIMHGGTVALPPDFINSNEGNAVKFVLAPGEMIYDLNGFSYQTYVYAPGDGVPANFGKELGGFEDVLVKDVLLDMYANRVNLEINAKVMLEMLGDNWVNAKLYTNKEDNADGKAGEFLCSVAPTTLENVFGADVFMVIDGGFFKPDGLHMNGSMVLATDEVQSADRPLAFTNMLIPPKKEMSNIENDPNRKFCNVLLDNPVIVKFQGFTMEVRQFDLMCMRAIEGQGLATVFPASFRLSIEGSTLLSDNIPLGQETTDRIAMESSALHYTLSGLPQAHVVYDDSPSLLQANLDDSVQITGVLIPKITASDDNLIEFDAETLSFGMLDALKEAGVDTTIRFGYDVQNKRCYYAVGLTSVKEDGDDAGVVDIGIAKINNFAGLFFHNMEPPKDIKAPEDFSATMRTSEGLKAYIADIPVYRGGSSTGGMGIICDFIIGDAVMLKDAYLYISSGPVISASGQLWAKTNLRDYKLVCGASLCYSHPERYLKLTATIKDIPFLIFNVSGSIGFEVGTRPMVFGVQAGYPETLKLGKILGVAELGVGFEFKIASGGTSYVAMKVEAGLDVDINLYIIYAEGYLKFGAEGRYEFRSGASDYILMQLWIKGGIKGGINAFGKKWNIISLYADALGTLEKGSQTNTSDTRLHATADIKIGYHLNVLLGTLSGSRTFHFTHTF